MPQSRHYWGVNGTAGNRGNCQLNYSYQIAEHNGYIYGTSLYRNNVSRIRLSDGKCMKRLILEEVDGLIQEVLLNIMDTYTTTRLVKNNKFIN